MLLFLAACDPSPTPGDSADTALDTSQPDTGESGDTGDTADTETGATPSEIAPGPDCSATDTMPITTPYNVLAGHVAEGSATDAELADLHTLVADWAPTVPGPWTHGVWGPLTSADGVWFDGARHQVITKASVADINRGPDGDLVAIYVNGDLTELLAEADAHRPMNTGILGLGGLGASTSPDGVEWTRAALSFDQPMPTYVVDPEVLALPDGRFALYYFAVPAAELCADGADPFSVPAPHRLYRAESEDLLHWSVIGEVWSNAEGGTDPAIWCLDGSTCYAWFGEALASHDGGLTFAPSADVSLESTPQIPDVVQLSDGSWRMYSLEKEGVEARSSADGLTWNDAGATGSGSGSPTAIVDGDTVTLWISGPK